MASGMRSIVINTQERAVSTDINRLQSFKSQSMAEIFRYMMDVFSNEELTSGNITEPNSIETPLRGEILNGLLVQPQGGTLSLLVQDGAVWLMQPDGAADDSNYKLVLDPGVTNSNPLLIGANSSGSVRVDIIECQMNTTLSVVNDNRDIFNSVSGQFTAQSVVKEKKNTLSYRVRAGTPGGGFPGVVSGWMPLCVASVPNGATNVDTITFWDVRKLVSERAFGVSNTSLARPKLGDIAIDATTFTAATGNVEAILNSRRVGGQLVRGSVGADGPTIDLTAAANQSAGFSFTNSTLFYLFLVFPFSLPRWVRYTDAPAARTPRGCRGIPILANANTTGAVNLLNTNQPNIAIPLTSATLGFATTVNPTDCVCIASCATSSTGLNDFLVNGDTYALAAQNDSNSRVTTLTGSDDASFTLVPGVDFPNNIRSLDFAISVSSTGMTALSVQLFYPATATNPLYVHLSGARTSSFTGATFRFSIPPGNTSTGGLFSGVHPSLKIYVFAGATPGPVTLYLLGWQCK